MSKQDSINPHQDNLGRPAQSSRHPITLENTPEETLKRMRSLPERAAQFREMLRARREANAR